MKIRRANEKDMEGINCLLCQVLAVHHEGRPDLFQKIRRSIRTKSCAHCLGRIKDLYLWRLTRKSR